VKAAGRSENSDIHSGSLGSQQPDGRSQVRVSGYEKSPVETPPQPAEQELQRIEHADKRQSRPLGKVLAKHPEVQPLEMIPAQISQGVIQVEAVHKGGHTNSRGCPSER